MTTSLEVIVIFMTASASLLSVMGNTGGGQNIRCTNPPENQTARLGGSVTISCNYQSTEKSTMRSFCRTDRDLKCKDLISTQNSDYTKRDRFSLKDDRQRGVYTVNISTLTLEDAGIYWCTLKTIDEDSSSCLTEIHLQVLGWDDFTTQPVRVTSTATITCSYPDALENREKFLCKGQNPFNCVDLINTTKEERDVTKGRFHIRDNKRIKSFNVNISNLSRADSGTYWCHSGRTTQQEEYTKIQLSVGGTRMEVSPSRRPTRTTTTEAHDESRNIAGTSHTRSNDRLSDPPTPIGMIVGIVVCSALLVVAVVILILYKQKLLKVTACCAAGESSEQRMDTGQNTEGNNGDHHYEEIQLQNQQVTSLPAVYATVNPPPDLLHYASVNIHNDGNTLPAVISGDQGATRPPEAAAAEATLYSTVTPRVEQ